MSFLNDVLKIDEKVFNEANESTILGEFEVLDSGVYEAEIQDIILYKFEGETKDGDKYSNTKMRVNVKLLESGRVVTYKSDATKTLKDGSANPGFLSRLKSTGKATNFDINNLKVGDKTTVSVYGKEMSGNFILGVNGKKVLACVRKDVDLCKAEGEAYRESNSLEAITHAGSDDVEKFKAKVEKHPNGFEIKCKKGSSSSKTESKVKIEASKEELAEVDF